jgi:hypothetical protein
MSPVFVKVIDSDVQKMEKEEGPKCYFTVHVKHVQQSQSLTSLTFLQLGSSER